MRQTLTTQILIGLPGTGKSSYAMFMQQMNSRVSVITRDIIRCEVLWYTIYEGDEDKQDLSVFEEHFEDLVKECRVPNMDLKIDKEERLAIERKIRKNNAKSNPKYNLIILDGCHTKWECIQRLLNTIRKFKNVYIELVFFGDYDSECHHKLTLKPEGDYSDYKNNFQHDAIPIPVLQRKRDELRDLFQNHMDELKNLSDNIIFGGHVILCDAPNKSI